VRVVRDFESGLSVVEMLIELIESPFLAVLKETLPVHGMRTRPSVADPSALFVVGAATVVCGGDRAADRELAFHWDTLVPHFVAAGMRVPAKPLCAQNFRDYRDGVLGGRLPEEFKETARDLFAGFAKDLGLFVEDESQLTDPGLTQTVYADGTNFAAATQVRDLSTSRSKLGAPRVAHDADRWTNGWGYTFCLLIARGADPRKRVLLDVVHAPGTREMEVVVPAVKALQRRLGPGFRCFVYDGAMQGVHHRELRASGLITVNKPKGIRRMDQWKAYRDTVMGKDAKLFELNDGCSRRHLLTVAAGMLWEVEATELGLVRRRVPDNVAHRRTDVGGGRSAWKVDYVLRCPLGDHTLTVDPNATYSAQTVRELDKDLRASTAGRATMNLSEDLRMVQVNDPEIIGPLFGLRNDAEATNSIIKNRYRFGTRSRSYTADRLDTDLWIFAVVTCTLAWREHCTPTGRAGRRRA
jgi:hypothetical protein